MLPHPHLPGDCYDVIACVSNELNHHDSDNSSFFFQQIAPHTDHPPQKKMTKAMPFSCFFLNSFVIISFLMPLISGLSEKKKKIFDQSQGGNLWVSVVLFHLQPVPFIRLHHSVRENDITSRFDGTFHDLSVFYFKSN